MTAALFGQAICTGVTSIPYLQPIMSTATTPILNTKSKKLNWNPLSLCEFNDCFTILVVQVILWVVWRLNYRFWSCYVYNRTTTINCCGSWKQQKSCLLPLILQEWSYAEYTRKFIRYKVPWLLVLFILLEVMVLALGAAVEEARYIVPWIELWKVINLDHYINLVYFRNKLRHM